MYQYMQSGYRIRRQQEKREKIKEIVSAVGATITLLVAADLFILFMSLAQIALEGRTGYWSPFWMVQAKFFLTLVGAGN